MYSTTIATEEKVFNPADLRKFYRVADNGIKTFIYNGEIARRLNLSDTRCYRAYLNPHVGSYRQPSGALFRLAYYVAQDLLAEGWQL